MNQLLHVNNICISISIEILDSMEILIMFIRNVQPAYILVASKHIEHTQVRDKF